MALEDQAEVRRGRDRMLQASTYGKEELVTNRKRAFELLLGWHRNKGGRMRGKGIEIIRDLGKEC